MYYINNISLYKRQLKRCINYRRGSWDEDRYAVTGRSLREGVKGRMGEGEILLRQGYGGRGRAGEGVTARQIIPK